MVGRKEWQHVGLGYGEGSSSIVEAVGVPLYDSTVKLSCYFLLQIEDDLSDESASLQMNLADLPLPGLADPSKADPDAFSESIKAAMHERLVSLKQLVHQGDHLRLKTVKKVLGILTWRQQVELLAGMSELVLALRKIGEAAKVKTYL